MNTSSRLLLSLSSLLALLLAGACTKEQQPSIDLTFPHGQRAIVLNDTALVEKQPSAQAGLDIYNIYLGSPGFALPTGTLVVRTPEDDPDASRTQSPTIDPLYNAWIRVTVVDSPVAHLKGRQGWVWSKELQALADNQVPPRDTAQVKTGMLAAPAKLCADTAPDADCAFPVGPDMPLHILSCQDGKALVGVWAPDGPFVAGFIAGNHFNTDPCKR